MCNWKQESQAILLFLSLYRDQGRTPVEYTEKITGRDMKFEGLLTNDAPCKYLLWHGAEEHRPVRQIFCLTSRDDLRPIQRSDGTQKENDSTFSRFQETVSSFSASHNLEPPCIIQLAYDYFSPTDSPFTSVPPEQRASHIYSQLLTKIHDTKPDCISIDFTGGMRDASFLLMELSRFLDLMGIPCREIVYSNQADLSIRSLQTTYQMFPLLNAIHLFLTTGSAAQLQTVYAEENPPQVKNLLKNLSQFSGDIRLCSLQNISQTYQNIENSLSVLERMDKQGLDLSVLMLKDLVPYIRKKMYLEAGQRRPPYLNLIQWCLDNGLLQQALTLYVEKVPVYLFEHKLLHSDSDLSQQGCVSAFGELFSRLALSPPTPKSCKDPAALDSQIHKLENILTELLDACAENPGKKTSVLADLQKLAQAPDALPALNYIVQDCRNRYPSGGKDSSHIQRPAWMAETFPWPKNIYGFLRTVANNRSAKCSYLSMREPEPSSAQDKRIMVLTYLHDWLKKDPSLDLSAYTTLSLKEFYPVLLNYSIIRAMRNQVNHANECQQTTFLQECAKLNPHIPQSVNPETTKKAIQTGIDQLFQLSPA